MQSKSASPDAFTKEKQLRLDEVAEQIIDLEEQIELADDGYTPERGTGNLIHAKITRGHRFDENTGKEISTPYVQMFTFGEFENFKKNAELIGYSYEILYNPFNK